MQPSFRIGTTSYIYPADILPNVRQLAGMVQDVELVLFEVDDYGSNLPTPDVVAELVEIAQENNMSYTVHLPLDLDFHDPRAFDKITRTFEATHALNPYAYILHLDGRVLQGEPAPGVVERWQHEAADALDGILKRVEPSCLCIENLETWSPEYFAGIVSDKGCARCVDVGHFWKSGHDPLPYLAQHREEIRVVHLHGVGERDHQTLAIQARRDVELVLGFLCRVGFGGVLTLEVFDLDDLVSSRRVVDEVLARWAND